MNENKTLTNFPEAFQPIVVVIGDRREELPKSMADLLVLSCSSVDILFLLRLNLGKTDILSDKIFVVEDSETLKKKFGKVNLLVIGSPAVNLLARRINDNALFKFNISEKAKNEMAKQEKILDEIKFETDALHVYREILAGATSAEEILRRFKHRPDKGELKGWFEKLFAKFKGTKLKNFKDLLHEFDRPGIKDPIDNKIHGQSPKQYLDYGFVTIARNPFSDDGKHLAVYAAGVHGPGTAHAVRLLADKEAFKLHPYGGVFEVQINALKGWADRLYDAKINEWQTRSYEERDSHVPDVFIKDIYVNNNKGKKEIFLSSRLDQDDKAQEVFNINIKEAFEGFHKKRNIKAICSHPYQLAHSGRFVREVSKKYRNADYIIHDITRYPRGVLFEIGISLGLKKHFFLLWNNTRSKFKPSTLPDLVREKSVIQIEHILTKTFKVSRKSKKDFPDTLEEKIFEPALKLSGKSPCPIAEGERDEDRDCCIEEEIKDDSGEERAYVLVPRQFQDIRRAIIEVLRAYDIFVLTDEELHSHSANIVAQTCCGLKKAKYCFVDISDKFLNGIITLGFAKAMRKVDSTLMLYKETNEKNILPMWEGKECRWAHDSFKQTLNTGIGEFIRGVRLRDE